MLPDLSDEFEIFTNRTNDQNCNNKTQAGKTRIVPQTLELVFL